MPLDGMRDLLTWYCNYCSPTAPGLCRRRRGVSCIDAPVPGPAHPGAHAPVRHGDSPCVVGRPTYARRNRLTMDTIDDSEYLHCRERTKRTGCWCNGFNGLPCSGSKDSFRTPGGESFKDLATWSLRLSGFERASQILSVPALTLADWALRWAVCDAALLLRLGASGDGTVMLH
jgi:hypothetical protein